MTRSQFLQDCVKGATSITNLAERICGYGHFDHAGEDYPVRREHIEEYLLIGACWQRWMNEKSNLNNE